MKINLKNKLLLGMTIIALILLVSLVLNTNRYDTYEELTKQGTQIAMYIEDDGGNYQLSDANQFPTDGYELNIDKSSCKNGGALSQNDSTKKIKLNTSNSDSCTLYFEKSYTMDNILSKLNITPNSNTPDFSLKAPQPESYTDTLFNNDEKSRTPYKDDYYTYADSYTFNTSTGKYTLVNPQVCAYSECYNTLKGKYVLSTSGWSDSEVMNTSELFYIYKVTSNTTLDQIYYVTSSKKENYNLSQDDIFMMEDDYGMSYYYRGIIANNYVKFANYYWRIIRINGNGTLRVIYDGTEAHDNQDTTDRFLPDNSQWNDVLDDAKYVGYMFGGANGEPSTSKEQAQKNETDSKIKTFIDNWYKNNIEDKGFGIYVSDTLFCNDRTNSGVGYGDNSINTSSYDYGSMLRKDKSTPQFKCPQKNDAFTVNDITKGNGALTYPVGLITMDEAIAAGADTEEISSYNESFYLHKGSWYWMFSPAEYNRGVKGSTGTGLADKGYLSWGNITNNKGVAPVINLSTKFIKSMMGDGTKNNPYRLQEESI